LYATSKANFIAKLLLLFFEHAKQQASHQCAIQSAVQRTGSDEARTRCASNGLVVEESHYRTYNDTDNDQLITKDELHKKLECLLVKILNLRKINNLINSRLASSVVYLGRSSGRELLEILVRVGDKKEGATLSSGPSVQN
jgi:hypothetical protein